MTSNGNTPLAPSGGQDARLLRVTVVMPTHNRKECLERTITGLARCDLSGLQATVRVVDDGSQDGTGEVAARLKASCAAALELVYVRQERQGQGAARNAAIRAADTDLLLLLDDDCVPEAGWFQALVHGPWEEGTVALAGKIVSADQENWIARYFRHIRYDEGLHREGTPVCGTPVRHAGSGNSAWRRSVLLEVGGFETRVGGGGIDVELCKRVKSLGYQLRFQPDAVVRHYHKETFAAFLGSFWTRGYRRSLASVIGTTGETITWKRLRRELWLLFRDGLKLFLVSTSARAFRREGAAAGDSMRFAFLAWVQQQSLRAGTATLLWRVLTGRQSLERTTGPAGLSDDSSRPVNGAPAGLGQPLDTSGAAR